MKFQTYENISGNQKDFFVTITLSNALKSELFGEIVMLAKNYGGDLKQESISEFSNNYNLDFSFNSKFKRDNFISIATDYIDYYKENGKHQSLNEVKVNIDFKNTVDDFKNLLYVIEEIEEFLKDELQTDDMDEVYTFMIKSIDESNLPDYYCDQLGYLLKLICWMAYGEHLNPNFDVCLFFPNSNGFESDYIDEDDDMDSLNLDFEDSSNPTFH